MKSKYVKILWIHNTNFLITLLYILDPSFVPLATKRAAVNVQILHLGERRMQ